MRRQEGRQLLAVLDAVEFRKLVGGDIERDHLRQVTHGIAELAQLVVVHRQDAQRGQMQVLERAECVMLETQRREE